MEPTELQRVLTQLADIIEDEKMYLHSLRAANNKPFMLYTLLATKAKHDIKWFGIRNIKELNTLLLSITGKTVIGFETGESFIDDEYPSMTMGLLTRITQSLYHQFDEFEWEEAIDIFVEKIIFGFNKIDNTLAFEVKHELQLLGTPQFNPDDIKTHVDKKEIAHILNDIPLLATLAFMSLLSNRTLFLPGGDNNVPAAE